MSVRRRKKAIGKIVKLLNLATSTNTTESVVALRHAEALIRQYNIVQRELPVVQLYDRALLYKVSWNSAAPRFQKETSVKSVSTDSVYLRRFSEKNRDLEKESITVAEQESTEAVEGSVMPRNNKMNDVMDDVPSTGRRNDQMVSGSFGNVIDAAEAFRPETDAFSEAEKPYVASFDPVMDFSDDAYWQQVHKTLADFDEASVQAKMALVKQQLERSELSLQRKKDNRHQQEQHELQERSQRAKIELSFEEAIEKAFQARAVAYERWEKDQYHQRLQCLREEQEALSVYENCVQSLNDHKASLSRHEQRKEDYRTAQIMHNLRRHLALSIANSVDSSSYEKVVEIMSQNGLSLKDLEFSDIQNKSLFIRLLERESALISDTDQRERYTEEMLTKFLDGSAKTRSSASSNTPLQHIQRLLTAANSGGQFETQKYLEQVQRLMATHDIGVKQIGYNYIKKYSVFISLINWEAERIVSLPDREAFTAQILEEYIQYSLRASNVSSDQKMTP
ncbi:DUF2786 domain-containing protein [Marinomonas sp. TI.3.20]|uniref:DUF2786 domain-containing protein n=1 Tax=Marinomonas sp. TI.3.20 TaxID=3121296 RepID=UPI00311D760B